MRSSVPKCHRGVGPVFGAALLLAWTALADRPAAAEACPAGGEAVRVERVPDWRSVVLADGRVLRLAGIESFAALLSTGGPADRALQEGADAALRQRVEALAGSAVAYLHRLEEKPDRHERFPALLRLSDEVILQERLVREGLAVGYAVGEPLPCFPLFLAAEADARAARRGFWAGFRLPLAYPDRLRDRIGRFTIFEGTVISVGNRPTRSYLNFGAWWQTDVTAEIAARDRDAFGGEAGLGGLAGQRVRLRGFVAERGGPMLLITSPMQLEALGPVEGPEGETP